MAADEQVLMADEYKMMIGLWEGMNEWMNAGGRGAAYEIAALFTLLGMPFDGRIRALWFMGNI